MLIGLHECTITFKQKATKLSIVGECINLAQFSTVLNFRGQREKYQQSQEISKNECYVEITVTGAHCVSHRHRISLCCFLHLSCNSVILHFAVCYRLTLLDCMCCILHCWIVAVFAVFIHDFVRIITCFCASLLIEDVSAFCLPFSSTFYRTATDIRHISMNISDCQ